MTSQAATPPLAAGPTRAPGGGPPARRRLFDLLLGGCAAVVTLPLAGVAALLVVIDDGWPVVFAQVRVGRGRRPFRLLKLRTMRDGRVTRSGRLLRALGLDELPQLVNVLRGDMSLVGPRPITPADVARLGWDGPVHGGRFEVCPGMTGMVQVVGTTGPERSLELERLHLEAGSLHLDLALVAAAAAMMVLGRAPVRRRLPALARWGLLAPPLAAAVRT